MHRCFILLCLGLILLSASCGRGGTSIATSTPAIEEVSRDAASAWRNLEQNPGVSGKDYDPTRILVIFTLNGQVPASWGIGSIPVSGSAASQPNPMLRADKQYEPLADAIAARYGLTIARQVYMGDIRLASFDVPATANSATVLQRIRSEAAGMVDYALYVPLKYANYLPNDTEYAFGELGGQWGLWRIGCNAAWDITLGSPSVMVAVVDTGVRLTHEELASTVINPQTQFPTAFCDVVNNDKTIEDLDGHGTFIAGVICAQGNNGRTITGVAPLCKVLPIKISNDSGFATVDDLIAGTLLADQLGARAINYSWGGTDYIPAEEAMVNQVTANGRLFVCAAGNDGTPVDEYPSSFSNAVSTGATNFMDFSSDFSNWGPAVDIAAPGEELMSCAHSGNNSYEPFGAGTSYAAPMVAAAAGLLWSYRPELTLVQVRTALLTSGPTAGGFSTPIKRLSISSAINSVKIDLIPSVVALNVGASSGYGVVHNKQILDVNLVLPQNVTRATYTLDLAPVGTTGVEDLTIDSTSGGDFYEQFALAGLHNQSAELRVDYFSATNNTGTLSVGPIWIFNQRGDVDGSGVVDDLDIVALQLLMGLRSSDAGYVSYADADLDGRITERDAASVGYYYGTGASLPDITAVSPVDGITGAGTSFTATIAGGGQTYAWDFGGGATPNTSALPSPTVTLADPGVYNASLLVSNNFGSDVFPFTLTVSPRPDPTADLSATPQLGLAPLDVTFDASGSSAPGGSIVQYEWSWDGDTVYEETTASPSNTHGFPLIGEYTVRLRVTDDLSRTAEDTILIRVLDDFTITDWGEIFLGNWGDSSSANGVRIAVALVGGKPAITWLAAGDPDDVQYVALATTATPTSAADFRIEEVARGDAYDSYDATVSICEIDGEAAFLYNMGNKLHYGRYTGNTFTTHEIPAPTTNGALANIGGKPAVIAGNDIHYVYATTSTPQSAADWVDVDISAPDTNLNSPLENPYQLVDVGGRAMYQGVGILPGDRRIVFATSNTPGPADWASYTWDGDHTGSEGYCYMWDDGGLPGLAFPLDYGAGTERRYWKASSLTPTQASDWAYHSMPGIGQAATLGGVQALFVGGDTLLTAPSGHPTQPSDWLETSTPEMYYVMRMVDHGGFPGLLRRENNFDLYYKYPLF